MRPFDAHQGAPRPAVRRPRREHYPDGSPQRTFLHGIFPEHLPAQPRPTPTPLPMTTRHTLRIILEIDGAPHVVTFLDPDSSSDVHQAIRLRRADGTGAQVAVLDSGPLCDCEDWMEAGCLHVKALVAARLIAEPEWVPSLAGQARHGGGS